MDNERQRFRGLRLGTASAMLALLSACGGGGGTNSTPPPVAAPPPPAPAPEPAPAPTPAPAPAPAPPPSASFQTQEYNRSTGPAYHRAIGAWQLGATGRGVAIGIVDSGLDTTNPEFAGRISSASADVAGSRGVNPEDPHGTIVALVAAAGRNGSGVMGIAYEATVMGLRADTPGSCSQPDGCSFGDAAIAGGIDRAVTNGAKVINLSLGGGSAGFQTRAAVGRAASAGVVVVVAAGNDADAPAPSSDPNNPNPFAVSLRTAGNGNVIIAGSVDDNGTLSSFSNRAGSEANWYLNGLGEEICCAYENGTIKVTEQGGQQYVTVYNGTSFAAPQISGAAALLRQAFPNLTARQVVNLLLSTAREAGATGTDPVYGRGILDITNAFAPQGTTSLAGTTTSVPLSSTSMITSAAMGDALTAAHLKTVILDSYGRAYSVDLADNGARATTSLKLTGALSSRLRQVATGTDRLSLALSLDDRHLAALSEPQHLRLSSGDAAAARVLAARVIARLSPSTTLGYAHAQGTDGLAAQLRGQRRPVFLIAGDPLDDVGFARRDQTAFALRHKLGSWGLTLMTENGRAVAETQAFGELGERRNRNGTATRYGVALDRNFGQVETSLAVGWLGESQTILGARLHGSLGSAAADSVFIDAGLAWRPTAVWRLGASWRQGYTHVRTGGLIAPGSALVSNAWALDVTRTGVFGRGDMVSFRLSQPLRVESGGLNFMVPTAYDYETLSATQGLRRLSLAPRGRELAAELGWRGVFGGGAAAATMFYRRNPGHVAAGQDDAGAALSWSREF